jgi:hypothetical protein
MWNIAVMMLGILATFVSLEGGPQSTFFGFWMGVAYGGAGQGIITMGQSTVMNVFKERLGKAMEAFMGNKTKSED